MPLDPKTLDFLQSLLTADMASTGPGGTATASVMLTVVSHHPDPNPIPHPDDPTGSGSVGSR